MDGWGGELGAHRPAFAFAFALAFAVAVAVAVTVNGSSEDPDGYSGPFRGSLHMVHMRGPLCGTWVSLVTSKPCRL